MLIGGVLGAILHSQNPVIVSGGATTALNPTGKNAHLTLSNGNLTGTGADGWGHQGARTVGQRSASGSISMTINNWVGGSQLSFGLCNITTDFTGSNRPGFEDSNGICAVIVAGGASLFRTSGTGEVDWAGSPVVGDSFRLSYNDATDTINLYRTHSGTETQVATANWAPDAFTYAYMSVQNSDVLINDYSLF